MSKVKFAVPTLLAVFALAFFFHTMGGGAQSGPPEAAASEASPTPYSSAHAQAQSRPGPAEEQAPTF